jgi:hypothetical protein
VGSGDPDGNALSYNWYFYKEAGSYRGEVKIENANAQQAAFIAPHVNSPATIHVLLTVTDNGAPPLSRYKRVVVAVDPVIGRVR